MREDSGLGLSFGTNEGAIAQASAITMEPERNETDDVWEDEELPVISIELERLVGFKPSTSEEIDAIKKQLIEAMWMRYKSTSGLESKEDETTTTTANTEDDEDDETSEPPPDFDDQIKELLDSRVARFGFANSESDDQAEEDSTDKTNPGPFLEITYPPRVLPPNASNENSNALYDTAKMWRDIRGLAYALDEEEENDESETHEFWYRLSDHLEHTGRLLSWKQSMALELKDILAREMLHKNHELWIQEQRTAKLEQLYQVRETLVHRKEVAQEDLSKLETIKDTAIRRDMLLYDHAQKRNQRNNNGGNSSSLFGGSDLNFPEEFELMGLMPKDSQLYEEEDWGGTLDDDDDFDYYQSDYSDGYSDDDDDDGDLSGFSGDEECERDDDEPKRMDSPPPKNAKSDDDNTPSPPPTMLATPEIPEADTGNSDLPTTSVPRPFLRRNKARRKKKARAQKKRELAEAAKKEAARKRKEHEDLLQQKHTTNELVLAQTLLQALDQKVQDVEELLENLQEEEWAAQEEQETKQQQQQKNVESNTTSDDDNMSLLDQILAMILGGLPMEVGNKDRKAHFQFVKDEHEFIVTGWKDYFGRLPQRYIPGTKNAEEEEQQQQDEESIPQKPTTKPTVGWKAPSLSAASHKLTTISRKPNKIATHTQTPGITPQEQRMALGLVDNEGDWEDDDE